VMVSPNVASTELVPYLDGKIEEYVAAVRSLQRGLDAALWYDFVDGVGALQHSPTRRRVALMSRLVVAATNLMAERDQWGTDGGGGVGNNHED